MSIDVSIRGAEEVQAYLKSLPEEVFVHAKGDFQKSSRNLQQTMTQRVTSGPLRRRSGALARSFKSAVSGTDLRTLSASVFTGSTYAPIHEYGGTIKAKRAYKGVPGGPYLNIPTQSNKTSAGRLRLSARDVFNEGGFLVKSKGPKAKYALILNGKAMFVLVKQVVIKAKLGMRKEGEDEARTLLSNLKVSMQEAIQ